MALKFVVGLFESKGIAEDAINRLRYEGVPDSNIFPMLMRETALLPAAVAPAIEALSVDPLILGNVRETYAPFIRNGETAVFVRAHSEDEVDLDTVRPRVAEPEQIPAGIPVEPAVEAGDGQPPTPVDLDVEGRTTETPTEGAVPTEPVAQPVPTDEGTPTA